MSGELVLASESWHSIRMWKGWSHAIGWGQCFVSASVLWHHWLGDTDIRPTSPMPLILNVLFQNQWRKRTTAEMFFQTQTACRLPKLTVSFKFVWARDQTCLPCESAADQFSNFRDIHQKSWLLSTVTWPLTLRFKLVRARDQTRLPCEYGANPFSGSRDIPHTNKKVTDSTKNRTLRSSLCAVMKWEAVNHGSPENCRWSGGIVCQLSCWCKQRKEWDTDGHDHVWLRTYLLTNRYDTTTVTSTAAITIYLSTSATK